MNEGNGPSPEGNAQGIAMWIILFAVFAVLTGFCAKYLYDWATGNLVTDNSGKEISGGMVVGVIGLTGLFVLLRLLGVLYEHWAKK
jgi:hypothetical protein